MKRERGLRQRSIFVSGIVVATVVGAVSAIALATGGKTLDPTTQFMVPVPDGGGTT